MATIESSTSVAPAKQTNAVFPKPAGLALGDLLVLVIFNSLDASSGTATSVATPSGWTSLLALGTTYKTQVLHTIADSGDVGATNFTFPIPDTTSVFSGGKLFRISAGAVISGGFYTGIETTVNTVAGPFVGSLDITSANNILFMSILGTTGSGSTGSTENYTVSGSNPTWTEQYDEIDTSSSPDQQFSIASAPLATGRELTSFQATYSAGSWANSLGALFYVSTPLSATGTNALLSVSPTTFGNTGVEVGGNGVNALHQAQPEFFSQLGKGTSPTIWTNEAKPSTTWTNEQK